MAKQPEGHCRCGKRDKSDRAARWLGPVYALYRIVRDHWPF
ncbi:hypothetical protein FHS40_002017 [Streptomyces spectabilis]|uniref:Uncharacterized protein n=1 Tax=Streptomyces spectabilis TaxID=68270 RepID=A0A7W8AQU5_STRST|nr:hypothetical protein [Streptomyces spectabilis]